MAQLRYAVLLLLLVLSGPPASYASRTFNIVNKCSFRVWAGTLSNAGMATLWQGGALVPSLGTFSYVAPTGWAGRVWGRTGCEFSAAGLGTCATGDCGRGLYCDGAGGIPPATLAEFTLDGYAGQDFYDVSLVDGYNLPLSIQTASSTAVNGTCGSPGCIADLNLSCPSELQVIVNGTVVACKSACEAFGTAQYCCSGAYNSPSLCGPTDYSEIFKDACPTAYSYAYDDKTSTFTCRETPLYTITFCPGGTSYGGGSPPGVQGTPPPPVVSTPSPTGTASPPPSMQTPSPSPGGQFSPPPSLSTAPPPYGILGDAPLPTPNISTLGDSADTGSCPSSSFSWQLSLLSVAVALVNYVA